MVQDQVFSVETVSSALICYSNIRMTDNTGLACALMSLYWRAGAASLALCWQLVHLVLQAFQAVQPAKSEAKWTLSLFLVLCNPC